MLGVCSSYKRPDSREAFKGVFLAQDIAVCCLTQPEIKCSIDLLNIASAV